jgi:hypothetical protein
MIKRARSLDHDEVRRRIITTKDGRNHGSESRIEGELIE